MVLEEVERVEVVVDEVGLRALGDAEAEAEEDVLDLAPDGGDHVVVAGGRERRAGQRDVDDVGREPLLQLDRLELRAARLHGRLDRPARLVGALADRAALLRRQLADVAQQVRQLGLAAEEAHADLFELGGCGGGGDRGLPLGSQRGDAVGGAHGRVILVVQLVEGHGRRHGGVEGVRVGDRDVRDVVARGHDGSRAGLRARRRRPASRRRRATARAAARPRGRRARPAGRAARRRCARGATGTENSAPIEARTALCPYGSALPGPSATESAPNASAPRITVPTLPGSATPHSATQRGPTGSAQRCG